MKIEVNKTGERIDTFLAEELSVSRTKIQNMIDEIKVNDQTITKNYRLAEGDVITMPELVPESNEIVAEDIPLDIVYEDEDLMVINKASGMVVHPAPGNMSGTLVNALLAMGDMPGDEDRPGIVHRLDKDTSGLMIVAKSEFAYQKLIEMMAKKKVVRKYLALVDGIIPHETGTVDAPIGRDEANRQKMAVTATNSKEAVTHFRVLERFPNNTLLECTLETGRTHQIRVHMAYIDFPITNDILYGKNIIDKDFGQMLHSYYIAFKHPRSKEQLSFEVKVPQDFEKICNNL